MPSRNSRREYEPYSFYHVYNRGVEKRIIFFDDQDYAVFLAYLRRHLIDSQELDSYGRPYVYCNEVELLAYCLMPNHFHMLVHTKDNPPQISILLQAVCTSYSRYFNKKHKRKGHLFQGRFKAVHINNDSYLQHISRYIHLNHDDYMNWPWSSVRYYLGEPDPEWLNSQIILRIFSGDYASFLSDHLEVSRYMKSDKYI